MNLFFTSQCHKNALTETRRVLDQFAERKGDRTWQTAMTDEGQKTVRRLLRKTARKNTAVACHWVRSKNQTELLWIVGDRRQFNEVGTTPTNTTKRNILRAGDENDWHSAEAIHLLAGTAALFHDLGKATDAFQDLLKGRKSHEGRNIYRHEWVSLRLFEAFVAERTDREWLQQLFDPAAYDAEDWLHSIRRDDQQPTKDSPFVRLPPVAQAIAWLIASHHRVPQKPRNFDGTRQFFSADLTQLLGSVHCAWNEVPAEHSSEVVDRYWQFSKGLPVSNTMWKSRATRFSRRWLALLDKEGERNWVDDPFIMHLARMTLMLADHNASSVHSRMKHPSNALFANTVRKTGAMNQELTEHLLAVTKEAGYIVHGLSDLQPALSSLARHKALRKRSGIERFRWQDKAADLAQSIQERSERQGAFLVNMASTGAGKTFANARIMYALSDPQRGARFTVALGLRTLTQQTGAAYRERLGLNEEELAIRVGGAASKVLFEYYQDRAAEAGSESAAALVHDVDHVTFEGDYQQNQLLQRVVRNDTVRGLVDAPVLVCTVDHLMPATESQRGGHQIAPMLRLLTSDLVLDEVDDFGLDDLPAISRLVHWAGMLGSRVMLSSATLPPSIIEALFRAYRAGRVVYQRNRGVVGAPVHIPCAWFDEHRVTSVDCDTAESMVKAHADFCTARVASLSQGQVKRRAEIVDVSNVSGVAEHDYGELVEALLNTAEKLHDRHALEDASTGKSVSFGLVRMANIEPLVSVARAIYKSAQRENVRIHLCVYHSQFPQIMRSHTEHVLDEVLYRGGERDPLRHRFVRDALKKGSESKNIFLILASPVAEVGRDHDYDWAIVEPSSMRSLIQLAGRVRRHRHDVVSAANITLLSHNIRALKRGKGPVFIRPGFEANQPAFLLETHDLRELLRSEELAAVDARPRIVERSELTPTRSLVDLEHARLRSVLLRSHDAPVVSGRRAAMQRRGGRSVPTTSVEPIASDWWEEPRATLAFVMQRWKPFRDDRLERTTIVFLPSEWDGTYQLHEECEDRTRKKLHVLVEDSKLRRLEDTATQSCWVSPWAMEPLEDLVDALAEKLGHSLEDVARRYTEVGIRQDEKGWWFHPHFGFFSGQ